MNENETMPRCMYCRCQKGRNELAKLLEENAHRQGELGSHVLRDQDGRYSVTGLAASELAAVMWVRHGGRWQCFHPEAFHDQSMVMEPGSRRYRQDWTVGDDEMALLIGAAGDPDHDTCPEEVLAVLGIDTEDTMPNVIPLNREATLGGHAVLAGDGRTLDDLDFRTAARLLREVPELLDECRCQTEAEWMLETGLRPHQVILVTHLKEDRLSRDDLVLAGALLTDTCLGERDDRFLEDTGREVLRSSAWLHDGVMLKPEDAQLEGARLSEAAREMSGPVEELREGPGSGEAERRYQLARLRVMQRHGLAPPGAERVLADLEGREDMK